MPLITGNKLVEDHAKLYDDVPNSAVDLQVKDKVSDCTKPNAARSLSNNLPQFLRKLNRQERVVEEVKLVLKPHFNKKVITKEDYKDIMRRAVPKVSFRLVFISILCLTYVLLFLRSVTVALVKSTHIKSRI